MAKIKRLKLDLIPYKFEYYQEKYKSTYYHTSMNKEIYLLMALGTNLQEIYENLYINGLIKIVNEKIINN